MLQSDHQRVKDETALQRLRAVLVPALVATALLMAGGFIAWNLTQRNDGPGAEAVPVVATQRPDVASPSTEDWLKKASDALNERRLLSPPGDNAIEYYLRAARSPETEVAARQAILELIPPAVAEIDAAIDAGNFADAERELKLLQQMEVSELRLSELRRRLADAAAAADTAAADAAAADTASADAAAVNAVATNASEPPAAAAVQAPAPPASDAARAAVAASTPSVPTQSSPPASPSPPPDTGSAAVDPPAETATIPAAPPTPQRTVVEPVQIADVRPIYPAAAARRRLNGTVDLEFTIGTDGSVSDITVIGSNPPGVFDREAVRAAMRWRFSPKTIDGQPVVARGRKTLSFKFQSG